MVYSTGKMLVGEADFMNIYPAIDMVEGRAVRLRQGRSDDMTVYGDPLMMARQFYGEGAQYLHMVDLDGAFTGEGGNKALALSIARQVPIKIQLGGGIRDMDTITRLLEGGIERVILGTAALRNPELVLRAIEKFGCERVVIGIDAREGRVAVQGWVEGSDVTPLELAQKMRAAGAKYIVYTDIARDGMLSGPNLENTRELVEKSGMSIIASGGVSAPEDVERVRDLGCEGAIIGKALYEGRITLGQALRIARG